MGDDPDEFRRRRLGGNDTGTPGTRMLTVVVNIDKLRDAVMKKLGEQIVKACKEANIPAKMVEDPTYELSTDETEIKVTKEDMEKIKEHGNVAADVSKMLGDKL